ncbi:hypothetical protein JCM10212_000978 [Sporobolomyces blumeae]
MPASDNPAPSLSDPHATASGEAFREPDATPTRNARRSTSTRPDLSVRTEPPFRDQRLQPRTSSSGETYASTTAHERPLSPVTFGTSDAATNQVDDRSRLHRRSSSRRRSDDDLVRAGASLDEAWTVVGLDEEEAVLATDSASTARTGFGAEAGRVGPTTTWAQQTPRVREPRRASTVELDDGTVIRQLPAVPPSRISNDALSDRPATGHSKDTLGDNATDPMLLAGSDSRLSVPLSTTTFRGTSGSSPEEYLDEDDVRSRRTTEGSFSPKTPTRPRLSLKTPRLSPLFQHGLSPVSALNRGRSRRDESISSPTRGSDGGWQELTSLDTRDQSPTRSPVLNRRATLTAAIGGLRRVSDRVVNLAGAEAEPATEAAPASLSRNPSRRESRTSLPTCGVADPDVDDEATLGGNRDEHEPRAEAEPSVGNSSREAARRETEASFRKLRGKTLFLFGPENRFRRACARALTAHWTEPLILALIVFSVVVQTIQSSPNVYEHPRPTSGYFHEWEDYALFAIFVCFSVELCARIVVTGLVINPPRPPRALAVATDGGESKFKRSPSLASRVEERLSPLPSPTTFSPPLIPTQLQRSDSYPPTSSTSATNDLKSTPRLAAHGTRGPSSTRLVPNDPQPVGLGLNVPPSSSTNAFSAVRAGLASTIPTASSAAALSGPGVTAAAAAAPYVLAIRKQRATYQQAFLRHSWNRIDAVAVVSFWVSFALAVTGLEARDNLWFFRALSVLRASRLLAITSGTQTILQSLKKASPLLVNTTVFIAFAGVLWGIIGLQSFRGSFRRYCEWIDPNGVLPSVKSDQSCGGHVNATGTLVSYLLDDGTSSRENPKGFICSFPSVCIESENEWGGAKSFDNIFASLLQVTVVASANTWTDIMYSMMDADYFVSCLYFIVGLVILNYWLINLFTAVITTTFADIRDETRHSAFASSSSHPKRAIYDDDRKIRRTFARSTSFVRVAYDKTKLAWVALVVVSVSAFAARQYDMPQSGLEVLDQIQLACTVAFDFEILIRLFASLPDWRGFFLETGNVTDTALAVLSSIILIPSIRYSPAWPWLTVFPIARFYRFIIAIPRMRRLLTKVLGTFAGLVNMILFLFMMTFLVALIAVEMFRGIPDPESDNTGTMDFYQIYNSFLAMYQILSSENWTDVVNTVLSSEIGQFQIAIAAIFLSVWMFFGFFVVGNLFIAVINENFAIAEEEKKVQQLETFINRTAVPGQNGTSTWLRRFEPFEYTSARSKTGPERHVGSTTEFGEDATRQLVSSPDAMQSEFDLTDEKKEASTPPATVVTPSKRTLRFRSGLNRLSVGHSRAPTLDTLGYDPSSSGARSVPLRTREATIQEHAEIRNLATERIDMLRDYLAENPGYDRTLYVFSQSSRFRQLCQRFVEPSYGGERINGRPASRSCRIAFDALVLVAIAASIAVAAYATPLYRHNSFVIDGDTRWYWPNLVEVAVGFVFVLEFVVKVVADGFLFSPNAYLLSPWNDIDFLVLLTLLVNIITSLVGGRASNRFTRALKAFRALRLINLWPTMRTTFHNVLILGFTRILDASILAVLYIVPFAVWGMQIFSGLLYSCNDSTVSTKAQCVGEYAAAVVDDWTFQMPRVWSNPYVWSFDSFRSALLILFEIISLEGWIDVMESVMQIVGRDQQPEENASQFNALFFVLYNCVGATFILTIFLSVIIDNLHRRSATSLLTTEQRQWLDLRRLLNRQQPSKRPPRRPSSAFRSWCFDRAAHKRGWWARSLTCLYVVNIVVLMTEATTTAVADSPRNFIYLGLTVLYSIDIIVRLTGFGWSAFVQNYWNLYDLFAVGGTLATTVALLAGTSDQVALQLQKLFLVSIVLKLVQRNDSLNQLQKTAVASLPAILNIFALWLVLFLVFAILYIEVFGLTRWEPQFSHNSNYYTFWNAMVLLVLQSTGEGWNEYMHSATVEFPRCTESYNYLESDCGSSGWAFALFSLWNILSMYLFVNLVLGAVIENFSFVFQDYGKVTSVNRGQMRSFKKLWTEFDPERTGYLAKADIPKFLSRLTGIFEVKVYRDAASVQSILGLARRDAVSQFQSPSFHHYLQDRDTLSLRKLDLDRLRTAVNAIDYDEIDRRRLDYTFLYHEAMYDADASGKGISFGEMLTLLAHYRLIDDDNALQIDELIERRAKLQHVHRRVRQDRLDSFFAMIIARRRYSQARQAARATASGSGAVPAIQVVDEDGFRG